METCDLAAGIDGGRMALLPAFDLFLSGICLRIRGQLLVSNGSFDGVLKVIGSATSSVWFWCNLPSGEEIFGSIFNSEDSGSMMQTSATDFSGETVRVPKARFRSVFVRTSMPTTVSCASPGELISG